MIRPYAGIDTRRYRDAEIAAAVYAGDSRADVAVRFGISIHTVPDVLARWEALPWDYPGIMRVRHALDIDVSDDRTIGYVCTCGWWTGGYARSYENGAQRCFDQHKRRVYTAKPPCAEHGCHRFAWKGKKCFPCAYPRILSRLQVA